jgi:hypothetical protein
MASMQATVRSRGLGAIFLGGFGTLWLVSAAVQTGAGRPAMAMLVALGLALICASSLMMRGLPIEAGNEDRRERARMMRWFQWTNAVQWVCIGAVILAANLVRRPDLIPTGISVVVGLHFIPLAYIFRNPMQYVTASGILAWDIAWLLREPGGSELPIVIGTGAILWITAATQIWMGYRLRKDRHLV